MCHNERERLHKTTPESTFLCCYPIFPSLSEVIPLQINFHPCIHHVLLRREALHVLREDKIIKGGKLNDVEDWRKKKHEIKIERNIKETI